jgi:hypothetical protein
MPGAGRFASRSWSRTAWIIGRETSATTWPCYLEEAYFWGNYGLLAQWPVPRQDGRGIMSDQIRGNAWGLRNIADARIQNPANPQWMITAPWEHDFLIWSLHHLTELGYADAAAPRDFQLRWRVGVFTHPDQYNPLLGAPYRMAVGELSPDTQVIFYEDWKRFGDENARLTKLPDDRKPTLAYDYSAYLALVCAVDAGFPQAAEALRVLLDITTGFHGMLADPAWRIVVREKGDILLFGKVECPLFRP